MNVWGERVRRGKGKSYILSMYVRDIDMRQIDTPRQLVLNSPWDLVKRAKGWQTGLLAETTSQGLYSSRDSPLSPG